jgi:hypothetical protein
MERISEINEAKNNVRAKNINYSYEVLYKTTLNMLKPSNLQMLVMLNKRGFHD